MDNAKIRRRESLLFIIRFIIENKNSPSYREICSAVGISSTSTAARDIDSLAEGGYLLKEEGQRRNLRLVNETCASFIKALKKSRHGKNYSDLDFILSCLETDGSTVDLANMPKEREDILDIPVYGSVAAGAPILAEDHVEDFLPLPTSFFPTNSGQYFILKVSGQSMIDAGIYDGDHVIVKRQEVAGNGQMVVALIDNEATVKTFYMHKDHIELRAENPAYQPILVKDCKILGLVVGLYRLY